MIKIEQSVIIHRPVEEVWQFMSNVENVTKWDRGVLQARQTSEGPLGVGSTLQTVRQFFARRRTGSYLVTEYEPNRKITLKATLGPMTGQVRYSVEPAGAGTRLACSAELGEIVGLYKLLAPILVRMLKRDGEADLANVKRIMEA